jgi:hypothetical protein
MESLKNVKLEMLLAQFDRAYSWTVVVNARYRLRSLAPAQTQIEHFDLIRSLILNKDSSIDVFIRG